SQVAGSPVFRQTTHQFVGQVRVVGDLAAIQIDRQRDVSLAGKLLGLLLHPVVQSPPLVNHDQRRKRPFAGGSVQNSTDGLVTRLVGNGLANGGESRHGKTERQNQRQEKTLHAPTLHSTAFHSNSAHAPTSEIRIRI